MATPLKSYLGRSIDLLRRSTAKVVQSEPTPKALPSTIFSFDSSNPPIDKVDQFSLGSDIEVGGLSTCNLSLIPLNSSSSSSSSSLASKTKMNEDENEEEDTINYSHMAFYGNLSTKIPLNKLGQIRTGYAGFRNISKPTLFGQDNWDLELYSHLKIKVGYRGWQGWRNRWVVNIGIDGRPKSDVFQHRLEIPSMTTSGISSSKIPLDPFSTQNPPIQFSTLHLPLSSFVLIKKGQISNSPIPLEKSFIRTIGFALLGRDRGDDGPSLTSSQQQQQINTPSILKSFNLGGWGKTNLNTLNKDDLENDHELKTLLQEDQININDNNQTQPQPPLNRQSSASRPNTSGYHRIGATEASSPTTISGEQSNSSPIGIGNSNEQEEREGYFELCIKSVEAVKWDPEMDGMDELGEV
ncbi:uncharacterized protein L201_007136 [Kwoniella dendrophila CBS 6074]|uniref:NADH:ubiquinone oxidoreductase intermediate-associated protein 30 domain-containing protein n=1 Tax=Kwoniella dendrophila CBS 6074 TaxID=1295534 RepID=A0AAX4K3P7_9TREE